MNNDFENSGFELPQSNAVSSESISHSELISYQSSNSLVYKVRINNKWLILKRLHPEHREHPAYIAALENEFNTGFQLDHNRIVKYLNKGTDTEGPYIIYEYVDGVPLRKIIKDNPAGLKDNNTLKKILIQILEALTYLHSHQQYHLDLKPENIIITHKGQNVKIIDFGLSASDADIRLTGGTRKYSSPEQALPKANADGRSDIYAFGMVALELLTGLTDIGQLNKLNHFYRKILTNCLSEHPDERYQNAEEVLTALTKSNNSYKWMLVVLLIFACTAIVYKSFMHEEATNNISGNSLSKYNEDRSTASKFPKSDLLKIEKNPKQTFNKLLLESKNKIDSLNNSMQKMFSENVPENDSLALCKTGKELYVDFIEKVNNYDENPGARNRKLVLQEFREACVDTTLKKIEAILSKYKKGTPVYYKMSAIGNTHYNISLNKIDSLIWHK